MSNPVKLYFQRGGDGELARPLVAEMSQQHGFAKSLVPEKVFRFYRIVAASKHVHANGELYYRIM